MTRYIPIQDACTLLGQEIGVSGWHQITQQQVNDFAHATGDFQWMHVDVERATKEMGGTIAHGLLTLSLLPMLSGEIHEMTGYSGGFSYGYDKVRFIKPVKTGSRVRLRQTLTGIAPKRGGTMVTTACVVEVQGEETPVLATDWISLYFF